MAEGSVVAPTPTGDASSTQGLVPVAPAALERESEPTVKECIRWLEQWSGELRAEIYKINNNIASVEAEISQKSDLAARQAHHGGLLAVLLGVASSAFALGSPLGGFAGMTLASLVTLGVLIRSNAWRQEEKRLRQEELEPRKVQQQEWLDERGSVKDAHHRMQLELLRQLPPGPPVAALPSRAQKQLGDGRKGSRRRRRKRGR